MISSLLVLKVFKKVKPKLENPEIAQIKSSLTTLLKKLKGTPYSQSSHKQFQGKND